MEELNIFIGSDSHCGHDVGLTPPEYNWQPPLKATHREHKMYRFRVQSWEWFAKEVKKYGPYDVAIWNGDLVDGTGEKSGGTEDDEIPTQVDMAVTVVRYVGARDNYFIRGTPYHTGKSKATWEDMVAAEVNRTYVGDEDRIGDEGQYDFNGLVVSCKHIIGNSASAVSRFTALSNATLKQMLWAETGQQERANLIIRSHIHRCLQIGEPERNRAAWITPALQGLGSVYGSRQVDGLPVHFGFLTLRVASAEEWGITAHIAPMTMQKARAVKYEGKQLIK